MSHYTRSQDSNLEVDRRKFGPQRIAMDHRLMKAVRSGDKNLLMELLSPEAAASNSTTDEIRITIPKNDVKLLGVTIEGNTALHIAAIHGYLELAEEICRREKLLLMAANTKLNTPLHCAARVGNHRMVGLIIRFARKEGVDGVKKMLRAKNIDGETALHEATQNGHSKVTRKLLKKHDAELASMVNDVGISPLYFAVRSNSLGTVRAIIKLSSKEPATWTSAADPNSQIASFEETMAPISAAGPDDQTALHAAVLQNLAISQELLCWKPGLTKEVDASGSTPLHYVASSGYRCAAKLLLECDFSTAYIPDTSGSMPIHVAASRGNIEVIDELIKHCPDADELLDHCGNNFLHVAVTKKEWKVVAYVRRRQQFEKLMNDKNYEGHTPLHLAVINGDQRIVSLLMQARSVQISTMDKTGFTPMDLSLKKAYTGFDFAMNPENWIYQCLEGAGASFSSRRRDHYFLNNCSKVDPEKETNKHLNVARNVGIASVLIATVTFAAAFTLPGGYEADDRPNPGTPILARRYAFKVFVISDTLALVSSIVATRWILYAGSISIDHSLRIRYLNMAIFLMNISAQSMVTTFTLGLYVVLSPISKGINILVCVMTFMALGITDLYVSQALRLGLALTRRLGWRDMLRRVWRVVIPVVIWLVFLFVFYGFMLLLTLL